MSIACWIASSARLPNERVRHDRSRISGLTEQMTTPLRIVVVNHVHPKRRHVSALRMRMFAELLASAGDQVILLSEPETPDDTGNPPESLPDLIKTHDWSAPLFVSCRPQSHALLKAAREGRIPAGLRQAILGFSYLTSGGVFADWRQAAARLLPAIAETFKPDVVLATFGNTDTWSIAQSLAGRANCPWIADMKDNWQAFVPAGFRKLTAGRFADMAHLTVYSEAHLDQANRWFQQNKTVIYSGFDQAMHNPKTPPDISDNIVLSGSLYDERNLGIFIDGVRKASTISSPKSSTTLIYAGNETEKFLNATISLKGICAMECLGFVDSAALNELQASARVNAYIANPSSLFQQKLLELVAAARPILVVPGESPEAVGIAEKTGGTLHLCPDASSVAEAIEASTKQTAPVRNAKIDAYSWAAQTERLRAIMQSMIDQAR